MTGEVELGRASRSACLVDMSGQGAESVLSAAVAWEERG
jgi:hypothetical protein